MYLATTLDTKVKWKEHVKKKGGAQLKIQKNVLPVREKLTINCWKQTAVVQINSEACVDLRNSAVGY